MAKRQTKKTDDTQQKIAQLEEQVKRSLADYQNLEKRTKEERGQWIRQANKDIITRLLPVLDTLILASEHVRDEGLVLSIKQFLDILRSEGVEKIETVGAGFDPALMEGVGTVPGEEGKVVQEVRPGFRYTNEGVLRPAKVIVGKEGMVNS
ncbi:MAG: nucleotide exchange factor GrpE [Candidatus Levybacteria bacterium]|nr:nucleotide exchange factor GrpE [Candidatus Levybacteria bacterium]